jgi:SAM-dependent methyltransferase
MAEREKTYWWHVGRLAIIDQYLKRVPGTKKKTKILNIGCGTGGTISTLEKFGQVENVDISDDAIRFMKELGYGVKKANGLTLPYKDKKFTVVGAFDVLEHIEDDVAALKEWGRVLSPGGYVVLTVPAYSWLWSGHDVSLHHYRRHTRKSVAIKAEEAGLKVIKSSYAIVFSLPLVVGFRGLNKILGRKTDSESSYVNVPVWVNNLFIAALRGEAKGHKFFAYPFGTSVIAILKKPE